LEAQTFSPAREVAFGKRRCGDVLNVLESMPMNTKDFDQALHAVPAAVGASVGLGSDRIFTGSIAGRVSRPRAL
jgi:hypothetical protein